MGGARGGPPPPAVLPPSCSSDWSRLRWAWPRRTWLASELGVGRDVAPALAARRDGDSLISGVSRVGDANSLLTRTFSPRAVVLISAGPRAPALALFHHRSGGSKQFRSKQQLVAARLAANQLLPPRGADGGPGGLRRTPGGRGGGSDLSTCLQVQGSSGVLRGPQVLLLSHPTGPPAPPGAAPLCGGPGSRRPVTSAASQDESITESVWPLSETPPAEGRRLFLEASSVT